MKTKRAEGCRRFRGAGEERSKDTDYLVINPKVEKFHLYFYNYLSLHGGSCAPQRVQETCARSDTT